MAKKEVKSLDGNKQEALKAALAQINKQFGQGAIMNMNDSYNVDIESCSTGSMKIDSAIGIGGLPYGRIVEIFGPESSGKTTLCLSTIAEAQKAGKTCLFIDAENALDVVYAKRLGVDVDNLIISQPDNGEDALNIAETMINSGAIDVVVIDSVAALVPKAEIEGSVGDSHMGLAARMMSQGLRKLTGIVKKNNVLLIFINQIRMKIGVMFGCLHGSNKVFFTDGRVLPISDVVKNRIQGKVWTYDVKNNLVSKEILDWHYNGEVNKKEDYQYTSYYNYDSKSKSGIVTTLDHEVFVRDKGWVAAKDLQIGDILISKKQNFINNELLCFVKGLLLSGSKIKFNERYKTYDLKIKPSKLGSDFDLWKAEKLEVLNVKPNKNGIYMSNLLVNDELEKLGKLNSNPLRLFKNKIPDLSMFLWLIEELFVDNDELKLYTYFKRKNDVYKLSDLMSRSGYNNDVFYEKGNNEYYFILEKEKVLENFKKFMPLFLLINKQVPYIAYRTKYLFGDIENIDLQNNLKNNKSSSPLKFIVKNCRSKSKIINISNISDNMFNIDKGKYDITVEDNHNYLAGLNSGVIVHNSPETTTGGNALKFYASVRIDIRRIGSIKKGEDIIGNETKVKVVKNKVAPPFKEAIVDIIYNKGFNITGEILDLAVKFNIVHKSGAWYSYKNNKIGQGRDNTINYLENNIELREELFNLINNMDSNNFSEEGDVEDNDEHDT